MEVEEDGGGGEKCAEEVDINRVPGKRGRTNTPKSKERPQTEKQNDELI